MLYVSIANAGLFSWQTLAAIILGPLLILWFLAEFLAAQETATATAAGNPPRRQPIPERVRHEVWRRDQGRCVDCGSRERLEFDHIIPVSQGGANTARNLELRCELCNRVKAARI
jgi:5-methylcytosine-specific restriction endonuclease McrA